MGEMKVSIIIPIRNRADNTKKLIDELVKQKKEFPQTEIICIENGSTEDMSFLEDYTDIILRHNEIPGVYRADNVALKLATGDYYCFIDNDDWIPDYYLRVVYKNIPSKKDWYVWRWYSDQTPVEMRSLDIKHPLKSNWAMWGYCLSRKLFEGIEFDEDKFAGDDVRVIHEIITENTTGAFIPEYMYYFKWYGNEDSISHIWNREHAPTGPDNFGG